MLKYFISAAAAAMIMTAVSCDKTGLGGGDNNPRKNIDLTTKSAEFVDLGNNFAFEFIDRISASTEKDFIISPLSMQFLLGMILDGAQGQTADEICNVLGYGAGEASEVNEYCLSMLKQLPNLDKKTKLMIANAIFVDDGWPLKKAYKDDMDKYYKATIDNLDFSNNAASLKAINGWCNKNTNGLIPKVLDEVSPDMLCYLLNALYFKSQWSEKFQKSATGEETFTDEAGNKGKVQMMKQMGNFKYGSNDTYQMVRMFYGNGAFSMWVFLPNEGYKVEDVIKRLKKGGLEKVTYYHSEVDLWIPKFETKFRIKLNDLLSEMGMPSAFDGSVADFSPMSEYALCLSFVQQDAIIKVDEEGTEAAAVSSAGMIKNTSLGPSEHEIFHADHPFLYVITEASTGAVLFAGRYSGK